MAMKKILRDFTIFNVFVLSLFLLLISACQKDATLNSNSVSNTEISKSQTPANPPFNIEVILRSDGKAFGHIKFRQDNDVTKIISLETWVRDLEPNHEYELQRAVDQILDGNCTGTNWLTLGKGLVPQSILTDDNGTGNEDLWRDISTVVTGSTFDIHFRIIDKTTSAIVLTSDCYVYTAR
jgi:hypothetical protein